MEYPGTRVLYITVQTLVVGGWRGLDTDGVVKAAGRAVFDDVGWDGWMDG